MSLLKPLSFQLILRLAAFIRAQSVNEYYTARWGKCLYSSPDLSDVVYINNFYFNKLLMVQFNSIVGKFVGIHEHGVEYAEMWNNSSFLESHKERVDTICRVSVKPRVPAVSDKTVKPKIKLRLEKQAGGRNPVLVNNPAVLLCSAYEFYPPQIKISWLRDSQLVTSDVTSVIEMAGGDWYYQVHSELAYTPKSGEKISCVVEHASFSKPMIYDWDPNLPVSERIEFIIGGCGLALGIITVIAGIIYYQRKLMKKGSVIHTISSSASSTPSTPRSESPLSVAVTCDL